MKLYISVFSLFVFVVLAPNLLASPVLESKNPNFRHLLGKEGNVFTPRELIGKLVPDLQASIFSYQGYEGEELIRLAGENSSNSRELVINAVTQGMPVDLRGEVISDEEFIKYFGMNGIFSNVQKLDLSGSTFNPELIVYLPRTLKVLKINNPENKLSPQSVTSIASRLTELRTLEVSSNDLDANSATQIATQLIHLKALNIGDNTIGVEGAVQIARNLTHLHTLNISNNTIGVLGASEIAAHLVNLEYLNVNSNNIGDVSASRIAMNLSYLHTLLIKSNQVQENGASQIATYLKKLVILDISFNDIGINGANKILECLKKLRIFKVRGNRLGRDFGEFANEGYQLN